MDMDSAKSYVNGWKEKYVVCSFLLESDKKNNKMFEKHTDPIEMFMLFIEFKEYRPSLY